MEINTHNVKGITIEHSYQIKTGAHVINIKFDGEEDLEINAYSKEKLNVKISRKERKY